VPCCDFGSVLHHCHSVLCAMRLTRLHRVGEVLGLAQSMLTRLRRALRGLRLTAAQAFSAKQLNGAY